jgi:hypothetical protein
MTPKTIGGLFFSEKDDFLCSDEISVELLQVAGPADKGNADR